MASRAPVAASPAPARAADPGSANRVAKTGAPRGAAAAPARGASSGIVDVSSSLFEPSQAIADEIEKAGPRGLDVRVIAKGLTEEGLIKVRQDRGKKYDSIGQGTMPLLNPWTQQLGGMHLNFAIDNSAIRNGFASFKPRAGGRNDWLQALKKSSALLGGLGLKIESLPTPVNKFEQGKLVLGVSGVKVVVGGYVDAAFDLLLENMEAPKVKGSADVDIRGAAKGKLEFDNPGNVLRGSVSLAVNFSSFNGAVKVAYLSDGTVDISGSAAYNANKLSGEIQFVATDLDTANKFAKDAIAAAGGKDNVQNAGPPSPVPVAKEGQKKRALAATGRLSFNLTTWFAGSVNVVVDGKGLVTVIGKIAPPGEIILFSERAWNKEIVKFEAKAYYGIPVVGNLNLFANISLSAIAKLGPARLYAIEILGTYSTDPEIQKNIQISGSINISAYGGLRLRAEGGAGIEILSHDLKFGIGLNADVGVKAYADARPTIGYRDPGVFYVSGTLDLVAQPMLGLGGEFFIELDAPWFSPLSDDRWSWPLFSKEWPLGEPLGMSATVKDYVLGSGKVPEIEMKPPEFDPSKFMTTMVDDKLPGKSGGKGDGRGTFKEDGSVPKPVVKPKLPPPKSASGKPSKKGSKPGTGKSAKPDSKAANEAKSTAILQKAAKPLTAVKGKGPFARASLDQELGKIRRQVSGIDFGVRANGAKWVVTPKAGRMTGKGLEIGAKTEAGASGPESTRDPKERVKLGAAAGLAITNRFAGKRVGAAALKPLLAATRMRYGLTALEPVPHGRKWRIVARINPEAWLDSNAELEAQPPGAREAAIQQLLGIQNKGGREVIITPTARYGAALVETLRRIHPKLLSSDAEVRKTAVDEARMNDKVWEVLQGMIYAPFVSAQQAAVATLGGQAAGEPFLYSLERGGSRLAEQVAARTGAVVISIAKVKVKQALPGGGTRDVTSKTAHIASLRARIVADLAGDKSVTRTVTITETMVGGGSTDQLINMVNDLAKIPAYANVTWKLLLLQQTIQTKDARGIVEVRQKKVAAAGKIKLIVASTPYILGEDVGYQSNRALATSKSPVILFKPLENVMYAYQIVPLGETHAADIIADLVAGKYNGRLPNVL